MGRRRGRRPGLRRGLAPNSWRQLLDEHRGHVLYICAGSALAPTPIVTEPPDIRPFAELARGPVATVYKAVDPASGQIVLFKRVHSLDAERRRRFADEARLAAGVSHPNVVRVLRVTDDALVAEWVEGADLGDIVDETGALPAELAALVARETARGLDAVHKAGILHRDVSAANVLLGLDGTVKLTDFGLASLAESHTDEVRGTLGTLAPEVVRGEAPCAASDLFSLGAVLVHALTGRAPFASDDASGTLDAVLHLDPTAPLAADPRVPDALATVAASLLAKNPGDRPASAAEAVRQLTAVVDALGSPGGEHLAAFLDEPASYRPPATPTPETVPEPEPLAPEPPAPTPAARPSRHRRAVGALVVTGALVAAGAVLMTPPDDPADGPLVARTEPPAVEPLDVPVRPQDETTDPPEADPDTRAESPAADVPIPEPDQQTPTDTSAPRPPAEDTTPPATRQPPAVPDDPSPAPAPAMGTLNIQTQPWAQVRVGDRDLGVTPPAAVISLPAGDHVLTLTKSQFPTISVPIRVEPGKQLTRTISLWDHVARVTLDVRPWASVTVDGQARGDTPFDAPLYLAPGAHTLTFENPGFETVRQTVNVTAGEQRVLEVRMARE